MAPNKLNASGEESNLASQTLRVGCRRVQLTLGSLGAMAVEVGWADELACKRGEGGGGETLVGDVDIEVRGMWCRSSLEVMISPGSDGA